MASSKTLLSEIEKSRFGIKPRCGQCKHFKDYPVIKVNGNPKLCSNEIVGRSSNDIACTAFSVSTNFSTLDETVTEKLVEYLEVTGVSKKGAKGSLRADARKNIHQAIMWLLAADNALLKGLVPFGLYHAKNGVRGRLVSWGDKIVTLQDKAGVHHTFETHMVEYVIES